MPTRPLPPSSRPVPDRRRRASGAAVMETAREETAAGRGRVEAHARISARLWKALGAHLKAHGITAPSVRIVWVTLMTRVPPWGARISRREIAAESDLDLRTTRYALDTLEELHLLGIERTTGGWHGTTNKYTMIPPPGHVEKAAPAGGGPAGDATTDAPPRELVERYALDRGIAADTVASLPAAEQWELLRRGGFAEPAAAPAVEDDRDTVAPVETAEQAAARMVREFHARFREDLVHVPLERELVVARGLLRQHGPEAWEIASRALVSLAALVRSGGRVPYTFLYLRPHLERAGGRWVEPEKPDPPGRRN